MFQICHHQVTFLKHFPTLMFVYISLVLSIGSLHVSSHLGMNLQSLFCHTIHCFASSKYDWHDGLIINMVWGISIDNLKRGCEQIDSPYYCKQTRPEVAKFPNFIACHHEHNASEISQFHCLSPRAQCNILPKVQLTTSI